MSSSNAVMHESELEFLRRMTDPSESLSRDDLLAAMTERIKFLARSERCERRNQKKRKLEDNDGLDVPAKESKNENQDEDNVSMLPTKTAQFNVRGSIFKIYRSTLEQYPKCTLARMASPEWNQPQPIPIDRDPSRFRYVLDFMYDGHIPSLPWNITKESLLAELSYFGFDVEVDLSEIKNHSRLADFCDLIAEQQKLSKSLRLAWRVTDYRNFHCLDAAEYLFKQFGTHVLTGSPLPLFLSLKTTGHQIDQTTKEGKATWAIVRTREGSEYFCPGHKFMVENYLLRTGLVLKTTETFANFTIPLATAQNRIELSTRPVNFP